MVCTASAESQRSRPRCPGHGAAAARPGSAAQGRPAGGQPRAARPPCPQPEPPRGPVACVAPASAFAGGGGRGVNAGAVRPRGRQHEAVPQPAPGPRLCPAAPGGVRLRFPESTCSRGKAVRGMVTGREFSAGRAWGAPAEHGAGRGSVCGGSVQVSVCTDTRGDAGTHRRAGTSRRVDSQTAAVEVNAAHTHLQLCLHKATARYWKASTGTPTYTRHRGVCRHTHTESHTDRCRYRCSSTSTSTPGISL